MALIRPSLVYDASPMLRSGSVFVRAPTMADFEQWAALRDVSRAHLTPFEPQWAIDELTRSAFRERLRRYQRDMKSDIGYGFVIIDSDRRSLTGGITLANVRRGVTQAACVGYWVGLPFLRRGYASHALGAVCRFAFEDLRLQRLEAASMPGNRASLAVLERAGFAREGLARQSLKINGVWEDHVSLAMLTRDWRERHKQ